MLKEQMIAKGEKYIDLIYNDPFIQGLISGQLDPKAVCHYLQADYAYLNKFADIYALCLAKSDNVTDKRFFINQLSMILSDELEGKEGPHQVLAAYTGKPYSSIVADSKWYPSADHYIKHMHYNIHEHGIAGALSAMGPCPWIYHEVAKKINAENDLADNHPFKKWIDFYAEDSTEELMDNFFRMIDYYSQNISQEDKTIFVDNFVKSCQHERRFFQMAVTQEDWED
ncbi:thiaminase II [Streptococcus pacificus]|uniref:Aminopyrimidine aminohydrolase n=1 Tax=Streptococcus pacificus TaxID=2740577 RepID=A0ABS0ZKH1_9STRE|nr:thiaminase II [Streptococcus pacificus]MBJ8326223.1 thiaminase II [Streptococcus pacificus]